MSRPVGLGAARLAVGAFAVVLAVVAWLGMLVATDFDQGQQVRQAEARAGSLALLSAEQVYRQLRSVDGSLRTLQSDWERDPAGFDAASVPRRASALSDIVSRLVVTDPRGRVVASSRREPGDPDLSARRFFAVHRGNDSPESLVAGPFQTNGEWFLTVSRRLDKPGGVFAGVAVASYDLDALMRDMAQADLGPRGVMMLVARDGVVRAISRRGAQDPGTSLAGSALFKAMFGGDATSWTGPSGADRDLRIHAWRPVPGQDMALVVGLDQETALAGSQGRRRQALLAAAAVTLLATALALAVGSMISAAAAREQQLAADRAVLEAANLQLARAREQADEKSAQLGTTLAGMSDGITMFDGALRLVQWNDRCAQLLGLAPDALHAGMTLEAMIRLQAAAGAFGPGEVAARVAQASRPDWPAASVTTGPGGVAVEQRRTPLPDGGWVTLYSDVTARREAEDAQARAREQAELAAQEKSRFVAIVSHEIRTPLNVALNALDLLDQSSLQPAQRRLVESGLLAGEALLGLLNDILDLSRMQVGQMQVHPAPFALRPLLDGVADLFRPQAGQRGVELSVHVEPGVPSRLLTDAGRLRQVLMNLVNNTAKFAEPGPAGIHVGLATLGGDPVLRVAVRDSGPDIPDLDRARLFRPFSQLERRGSGGTGLGLAICQLLANLLGGQIGCDPTGGGGKEFWLTLPADVLGAPAEPALSAAATAAPGRIPRTRVLLVEDVPANQMVVATVLRREGHMVDCAGSGLEAVAKVASAAFDIVLLDIFMPGIDGMETARRIRALPGVGGTVPIVALTANVSEADRVSCLACGMDDLVAKPVERAMLLAAIGRHVWRAGQGAAPLPPPPAVATGAPGAVFDLVRVAAWQSGLPAETCDALLADCLDQLRAMLPPMRAALAGQDQPAARRIAHAMVGVASNYGLSRVEAAARAIGAAPGGVEGAALLDEEIGRAQLTLGRGERLAA